MKKILAAVDFSETSKNSLNYAVNMAQWLHADLILLHVIYTPAFISDEYSQMVLPAFSLKEDCDRELMKMQQGIQEENPRMKVEYVCVSGVPSDEVVAFASANHVDLIIAGIQGVGYVTERWIGSTASAVMKQARCPVIVVDREQAFTEPRKIVLATDFETIPDRATFRKLETLTTAFKAHLHVLHVHNGPIKDGSEKREALKEQLGGIQYSFCYAENADVIRGINEFVEKLKMDMVVMLPHRHTFVERIFRESNTTRLAFHSQVPILTLPPDQG